MKNHYKAPWSTPLITVSLIATLLCLWAGLGLPHHHLSIPSGKSLGPLILALPFICAFFVVRGYTITPEAILVHRLFWNTRLPRTGLQSASFDPNAMSKSIRTCGNGGFFSCTGWYWNKTLRSYRAFVTDPKLAVVLRYEKRTIVISPESPEDFVQTLMVA